jgi:hypothetical protein
MDPVYVELHAHSGYSFLDGASHPEELVLRAVELGYPPWPSPTTTGCTGAWSSPGRREGGRGRTPSPGWRSRCTGAAFPARGFRRSGSGRARRHAPAPGPAPSGTRGSCLLAPRRAPGRFHLTLLAETPTGYANLCRLVTEAHRLPRGTGTTPPSGKPRPPPGPPPGLGRWPHPPPHRGAHPPHRVPQEPPGATPWPTPPPPARPSPAAFSPPSAPITSSWSSRRTGSGATPPGTVPWPASPTASASRWWPPGTSTTTTPAGTTSRTSSSPSATAPPSTPPTGSAAPTGASTWPPRRDGGPLRIAGRRPGKHPPHCRAVPGLRSHRRPGLRLPGLRGKRPGERHPGPGGDHPGSPRGPLPGGWTGVDPGPGPPRRAEAERRLRRGTPARGAPRAGRLLPRLPRHHGAGEGGGGAGAGAVPPGRWPAFPPAGGGVRRSRPSSATSSASPTWTRWRRTSSWGAS